MSEKERQNLSEKNHDSDDKQIEVDNAEATLDITIDMNNTSSEIVDHMLQQNVADNSEVKPVDVITIEDLSNEWLEKNTSENSQCTVIEFSSDDESETDSHCSQVFSDNIDISLQASSQEFDENSLVHASRNKRKTGLIEVVDTESLNKKYPVVTCITETWEESERKRKKSQISEKQNKRNKEIPNPSIPVIQCPSTEDTIQVQSSSSGEFADAEDSSSSDNNGSNSPNGTAKRMPLKGLSSGIQQVKDKKKCAAKVESSCISSPICSQYDQLWGKTEENTLFPSFLKGETIPVFELTDEAKKKFELSMSTIFEARESDSDEKIRQPLQSKTNPLKIKTAVGKRKDKCNVCNARLGLCAIECRCGGYYCAKHRYDKEHNCTFDYKTMGAAEIRKNNPRIVAEKIRKL